MISASQAMNGPFRTHRILRHRLFMGRPDKPGDGGGGILLPRPERHEHFGLHPLLEDA